MPSIGDLYRFTTRTIVGPISFYNIDFKVIDTLPPNPLTDPELANAYYIKWANRIHSYLIDDAILTSVLAENLTDGLSFGEYNANTPGGVVDNPEPNFVAVGISLQRSTKLTRNGYKRISGLAETQISGNQQILSPAAIDDMESVFQNTVEFSDITNPADSFFMNTVIVGRTLNASGVYELDLTKINPVVQAVMNPNVTSQRTRKLD